MGRRAIGTVLGILLLVAAAPVVAAPMLPAPTGPHPVGRRVVRWTDTSRAEVLSTSPADRREVIAWIWYPASPQAGAKAASYVDEFDRVAKRLSHAEASIGRKGVAHAVANAPISDAGASWPIVAGRDRTSCRRVRRQGRQSQITNRVR
jgi:hypothetical protein